MRKWHQKFVFFHALRVFKKAIDENIVISDQLLNRLIYGWGNQGFSAHLEYASEVVKAAKNTEGPILECGSGLSTILMGIIAKRRNIEVISLEHDQKWFDRVKEQIDRMQLANSRISYCPLVNYEEFDWYDTKNLLIKKPFNLIICDGPPGRTKGGRYGLMPLMYKHMSESSVILMDDVVRLEDKGIMKRWLAEFPIKEVIRGSRNSYALITQMSNAE